MVSSSKGGSASDSENSSGDATESASKSLFSEGEKVLAFHGPRIYEAKVQKAEFGRMNGDTFSITFWDEWVGMDRLMKYTEENIMKQQALDKKAGVDKNTKSGRSAQAKLKGSADAKVDKEEAKTPVAKGRKRKADSGPELVKLPRFPNVDDILTRYLEHMSKKDGIQEGWHVKDSLSEWMVDKNLQYAIYIYSTGVGINKDVVVMMEDDTWMADIVGEILTGLRSYFDKALPAILLYKKERQQYREAISDNTSPSSIYGAEHLLHLFVKLPELLAYVKINEDALIRLQQKLLEFLRFLQNNENTFCAGAYYDHKVTEGGSKGKDK